MKIREYTPADLSRLEELYLAQGFDYAFPDLEDPRFITKKVLEDRGVEMAIVARLTAEGYFLVDPRQDPRERWAKFQALHRAAESDLLRQGLEDVHCWTPPQAAKFARRLKMLGWVRDDRYTPFCKYLTPDPGPRVELELEGGDDGTR